MFHEKLTELDPEATVAPAAGLTFVAANADVPENRETTPNIEIGANNLSIRFIFAKTYPPDLAFMSSNTIDDTCISLDFSPQKSAGRPKTYNSVNKNCQ